MNHLVTDNNKTGRDALRMLNDSHGIVAPVLFVVKNEKIDGSLTDGDIRRGLLAGLQIDDPIEKFLNKNFKFFTENNWGKSEINNLKKLNIRFVPEIDSHHNFLRILDLQHEKASLPLSAVIMAGGKGERLLPLTQNTPKPLLKVGDKPIIEHNIDRLIKYGITDIYISVRYLAEQLVDFFGDGSQKGCKIQYIFEDEPLGTIGALGKIENLSNENLILLNSDLLTNIDYEDFYRIFKEEQADMAIASTPFDVNIPYAVLEFSEGKNIKTFKEKPKYTYYSNAGIYLIKASLLNRIPKNEKSDATDFLNGLLTDGYKVISEPIHGYWLDIGRIEDYFKAQEDIRYINL
jgi:dTDP-glucose pyrophosphorylase